MVFFCGAKFIWLSLKRLLGELRDTVFVLYNIIRDNKSLSMTFAWKWKWWLGFIAVVALVVYHWPVNIVSLCDRTYNNLLCYRSRLRMAIARPNLGFLVKYSFRVFFDFFVNCNYDLCMIKVGHYGVFPSGWTTHYGPYGFIWCRNSQKNAIYLDLIHVHSFFVILFRFLKRVKAKIAYILSQSVIY